MNELLNINYDSERPTVLGRDLHNSLGITTRYNDWFKRMCEYGFLEGKDFYSLLEELNAAPAQQIAELQPKVSYYDVVLNCKDALSVSVIAKDYGWSAKKMNQYLHEHGVQYKQGNTWLLYARYAEQGYTSTRTNTHIGKDGDVHTSVHTYWTQKGRLFIYVLPLVERMQELEAQ